MGFSQTGWECGHKIKDVPLNECVVCLIAEKDKEIERLRKALKILGKDIPCDNCLIENADMCGELEFARMAVVSLAVDIRRYQNLVDITGDCIEDESGNVLRPSLVVKSIKSACDVILAGLNMIAEKDKEIERLNRLINHHNTHTVDMVHAWAGEQLAKAKGEENE